MHPRSLISAFVVRWLDSIISLLRNFEIIASFCGCAGRFVSGLVGSSRRQVLSCRGSNILSNKRRPDVLYIGPLVKLPGNF